MTHPEPELSPSIPLCGRGLNLINKLPSPSNLIVMAKLTVDELHNTETENHFSARSHANATKNISTKKSN